MELLEPTAEDVNAAACSLLATMLARRKTTETKAAASVAAAKILTPTIA